MPTSDETAASDVLTQISAVQAALDEVALGLLDDHPGTAWWAPRATIRSTRPRSSWLRLHG